MLTALGLPEDMSSHRYEGPRFFLWVAITMISKRFIELDISVLQI